MTKQVTLQGELGRTATDGRGQVKAGVEATTKINRKDFGVSWSGPAEAAGVTLGDEISITFDLQFIVS